MPTQSALAALKDNGLATAIIAASTMPLLLIDRALAVVAASQSFSTGFGIAPDTIVGKPLSAIGSGEWGMARLRSLLETTLAGNAAIPAYAIDLRRKDMPDRHLILNAQRLAYPGTGEALLLLMISDVTEARAADNLVKVQAAEKETLFQELQHRVANSLQIIASVLMQSARRVQSDETRGHLRDAHHRVLSVAVVQSHLAASRVGDVNLRTYLTDLCRSLAASMIHDPEQITLDVQVGDGVTDPDTSMGIGLIVTELVINALKHAFVDHRKGRIVVSHRITAQGWILSVADDGVGITGTAPAARPGLGTSIVEALAKKLKAHVVIASSNPGTIVSITRG